MAELLAVLALVAALVLLGFPAFSALREHADRSVCLSRLRMIDVGLQSYLSDHRWIYHSHYWQWPLPPSAIGPGEGNSWFTAAPDGRLTGSYLLSSNSLLRGEEQNPFSCRRSLKKVGSYHVDYAYNLSLAGVRRTSLSRLGDLVTVVEGGDDARVTSGVARPGYPQFLPGGTAFSAKGVLLGVHRGYCNALFADGHVKSVKPESFGTRNFDPFPQFLD